MSHGASLTGPSVRLTANNHGPAVILAAAIMLGVAVLTLGMRLYQRWPWRRLFKVEDAVLVSATIFSIGMTVAAAEAVASGLGQHAHKISSARVNATRTDLNAVFATAFATQGVACISFALMLRSINAQDPFKSVMLGVSGYPVLWSLAAVIRFAAASDSSLPQPTRASWIAFSVLSILNQILLAASSVWMVWPLRMGIPKKIEVTFWFLLCIPAVIAATIVRLVYTPSHTFGTDYTWNDTTLVIILLVETNMMIVSAACPSLRNLLSSVSTGFLVAETRREHDSKVASKLASKLGYSSKSGSNRAAQQGSGGSYGLSSIGRRGRNKLSENSKSFPDPTETSKQFQYNATVRGDEHSERSYGSEAIIVRRSIDIDAVTSPDREESGFSLG